MPLLCKQRALYVKGCVIPNGITDSQGDTLYQNDIKKIFTSFNNQDNFEVLHNDLALSEVSLLENYISTADERIGNLIVPPGSWNCVIRVDNPEIKEKLLTGELGGLSLSNRIAERCQANLHGTIRYKDVADAECVIPKWISFVEGGANGYPLHVMDYDAYILKSKDVEFEEKNGDRIMDFKEFLNGLKSLIKEAEDTPSEEEPAIEKEDEAKEEEEAVETPTETEPVEEEAASEEEPTVKKEDDNDETVEEEPEAEEEDPAEIEKADETPEAEEEENDDNVSLEERVAALEEAIAKLTATNEEDEDEETPTPDPEEEPEDEDTPKITKSEKVVIGETKGPQTNNYYDMSGRDPLTGKKIRK